MLNVVEVGKVISFLYPVENKSDRKLEWTKRRALIQNVRDCDQHCLDQLTVALAPTVLRGRILLTALDLDKQALRSFYVESMRRVRIMPSATSEVDSIRHDPCLKNHRNDLICIRKSLTCVMMNGPTQVRAPEADNFEGRMPRNGGDVMATKPKVVERITRRCNKEQQKGSLLRLAMYDPCEPSERPDFFGRTFTNSPDEVADILETIAECNEAAIKYELPYCVGVFEWGKK